MPATAFRNEFIALALRHRALRFGSFTLKSGRSSPYFFNAGEFSSGGALAALGRCYAAAIAAAGVEYDMLFGPAYKGIPLAVATAVAISIDSGRDVPCAFNRKEAKTHGEGGAIVGANLAKAGSVIVLDDVITDGATKYEVIDMLRGFEGLSIAAMLVGVDRQDMDDAGRAYIDILRSQTGVRIEALTNREEVLKWK